MQTDLQKTKTELQAKIDENKVAADKGKQEVQTELQKFK